MASKQKILPFTNTEVAKLARRGDVAVVAEAGERALAETTDVRKIKHLADALNRAKNIVSEVTGKRVDINRLAKPWLQSIRKGGRILREMAETGERAGPGGDHGNQYAPPSHGARVPNLDQLGFTYSRASRWQTASDLPENEFEALSEKIENSDDGILAFAALMAAAKAWIAEHAPIPKPGPLWAQPVLYNCDLVDAPIEADSLDFIITDPPYPEEFIDLYAQLAVVAGRWLKPGGSLLAMAGQSHLPQVMTAMMSAGLAYHWTLAYLTPGGQAVQIFPRNVNTFWKPIFWFVKGDYDGQWIGDVAASKVNDNDKRFHNWGQSESGFADLIERFTQRGDVICDPFMGGGTTGVVALARGRNFIGVEKDVATFAVAQQRLGGDQ